MKKPKRSEADVLRSVKDLLTCRGIWHLRRNVGKVRNPSGQWVEFGHPGESDLFAIVRKKLFYDKGAWIAPPTPLFIEVKGSEGKQSLAQEIFQRQVEAEGCPYLLVRSASEVNDWLNENT
jgi:hypothetical protein